VKKCIASVVLGLVGVFAFSCIEEIAVFKGSDPTLVVFGEITNGQGPHIIQLSYSKEYNQRPSYEKVDGASVVIVDDLGNQEELTYTRDGAYETSPDFFGVAGRAYHVEIELESGGKYNSNPEVLPAVPFIDAITVKKEDTQVGFYIDFVDNAEEENYYRWRYNGTYEVMAPEAYELSKTNQNVPSNPRCYDWGGPPPRARDVWQCWVKEFDSEYLRIDTDEFYNGRAIDDFKVFSKDIDRKFDRGYVAIIRQFSISKEAYKYWNAIKDQIGNNGTIFETSNYQIRGNIVSQDNPKALVLGYFGAASVAEQSIFVGEFMGSAEPLTCEPNNSGCLPQRCLDCRKYAANSTNQKPDYWPL
jgi:hypothetical protein